MHASFASLQSTAPQKPRNSTYGYTPKWWVFYKGILYLLSKIMAILKTCHTEMSQLNFRGVQVHLTENTSPKKNKKTLATFYCSSLPPRTFLVYNAAIFFQMWDVLCFFLHFVDENGTCGFLPGGGGDWLMDAYETYLVPWMSLDYYSHYGHIRASLIIGNNSQKTPYSITSSWLN